MLPLLESCVGLVQDEAWCDLWLLYDQAVGNRMRRWLQRHHVGPRQADIVVRETFAGLARDNARKLRTCQAQSTAQLCAWLKRVGMRAARNWLAKRRRQQRRRRQALAELARPDRSGPDAVQLEARLRELQSLMTPKDFNRLLIITGQRASPQDLTPRTERRWIRHLIAKYRRHF